MRWFPVAFLTKGISKVTHGRIQPLCCESACLTTTLRHHYTLRSLLHVEQFSDRLFKFAFSQIYMYTYIHIIFDKADLFESTRIGRYGPAII